MLESLSHQVSSFVTLTYDGGSVPADGSVSVLEGQNFLRRLDRYYDQNVRYFLIGEYGDRRGRPHYHAALFGVLPTVDTLDRIWDRGGTHVGNLEHDSAAYLSGYITKKWTRVDDWNRAKLAGRHPEFARMSKRPAIGAAWVEHIFNTLTSREGAMLIAKYRDVPVSVVAGGREIPLGRYLRCQLRLALFGSELQPEEAKAYKLEVLHNEVMQKLQASLAPNPRDVWTQKAKAKMIDDDVKQRVRHSRLVSRHEIALSRKKL